MPCYHSSTTINKHLAREKELSGSARTCSARLRNCASIITLNQMATPHPSAVTLTSNTCGLLDAHSITRVIGGKGRFQETGGRGTPLTRARPLPSWLKEMSARLSSEFTHSRSKKPKKAKRTQSYPETQIPRPHSFETKPNSSRKKTQPRAFQFNSRKLFTWKKKLNYWVKISPKLVKFSLK